MHEYLIVTALFLHRNPGHNVKTTLIKTIVKVKVKVTLDGILRRHPDCGIILIGDFNQLRDMFLRTRYGFAQLVNTATRNSAILDKVWTDMNTVYDTPAVLDTLGTSDHRMVLLKPSYDAIGETGASCNKC